MRTYLFTARRLFVACALLLLSVTWLIAQNRTPASAPATPAAQAAQALAAGRFDEVDRLVGSATDGAGLVVRARAAIARGRYQDAEKLLAPVAAASPAGDAALELGRLQMYLGRRDDGSRTLSRLFASVQPRTAADSLRLAEAARALGRIQDANGAYRDANRQAPNDAAINTAWGEFFLEKQEIVEAAKSFDVALKTDGNYVPALVGLARTKLTRNPPAASTDAQRVLSLDPNNVAAQLVLAEIALDDRRRAEAREAIAKALQVNPNSLEARALDAAIDFLEGKDDEFERRARQLLEINPVYGEVYRVAGDHAARNYRFEEAVALTRRALTLDPQNLRAYADLGSHLLRTGDEAAARVALETAFKADRSNSNAVTKNLLELLDTLDTFQTVTEGNVVMRFAPEEVAVMREYAMPLAHEALAALSKRYQFTPSGPILVEMFPRHDDFAVRTIGLPGMVGALGACFGRVVTLDSPKARPPGEFHWGATLWHELAHVITLQMSNNRVPRWLTEGISVFEEKRARPEWGREMEVSFAQAMNANKIMRLDVLNEGFSDPRMISLAYYQASLVVEHLVDSFGEPKLHALLRAYGRGLETDEAIREALGVSMDDLQKSFDARLERDYGALRKALQAPKVSDKPSLDDLKKLAAENPGSFAVQLELGRALAAAKDPAGAIQAFERAAALVPAASGEDNPNAAIAAVALEQKDTARAIRALEAVVVVDNADIEAARKLAGLLASQGDAARTETAYRRVVDIDPFDSNAQTQLGRLALARRDTSTALRAFRAALASKPADVAAAHTDLAEAYLSGRQLDEAKKQALAALEIAPAFERAQDLLLKIVDAGGGGA